MLNQFWPQRFENCGFQFRELDCSHNQLQRGSSRVSEGRRA
jgi:hypothetical protein